MPPSQPAPGALGAPPQAHRLLFERLRIQDHPGVSQTPARLRAWLDEAYDFAREALAPHYRESDEEECRLDAEGRVVTPKSYPAMIKAYRAFWQTVTRSEDGGPPQPLLYMMMEALMGAHPAFMTYVGFNEPAVKFLAADGSEALKRDFIPGLQTYQSTACLCITEKECGTDLTRLATRAEPLEDGAYAITGHKWLISAGSHELTDNIVYVVLARTGAPDGGMLGLSCFVTPRYLIGPCGERVDNGIRCLEVVEKMGLRGCANTHLTFGEAGVTRGYLIGSVEGRGISQLMSMMIPARISTGIYALGIAARAHDAAVRYSTARIQGRRFHQSMNTRAEALSIDQHPDVRRMLLEMGAYVSGCRAMIAYLGWLELEAEHAVGVEERRRALALFELLTPVVKAYVSDTAWRVTELSIQVHGGVGYLRGHEVEQCARDCKVLSIWEGTNHMQSQFLVRDRLGLGVRTGRMDVLRDAIEATLTRLDKTPSLAREVAEIATTLKALCEALRAMGAVVSQGGMERVPFFTSEFQSALGDLVIAWRLLDLTAQGDEASPDGELGSHLAETLNFFTVFKLPRTRAVLSVMERELAGAPGLAEHGDGAERARLTAHDAVTEPVCA